MDYSALVNAIYDELCTWPAVAAYMREYAGCDHKRSYWYEIGRGAIKKPGLKSRNAIVRAAKLLDMPVSALTCGVLLRKNITVSTMLYRRLNALRCENSLSWNEVIESLLEGRE